VLSGAAFILCVTLEPIPLKSIAAPQVTRASYRGDMNFGLTDITGDIATSGPSYQYGTGMSFGRPDIAPQPTSTSPANPFGSRRSPVPRRARARSHFFKRGPAPWCLGGSGASPAAASVRSSQTAHRGRGDVDPSSSPQQRPCQRWQGRSVSGGRPSMRVGVRSRRKYNASYRHSEGIDRAECGGRLESSRSLKGLGRPGEQGECADGQSRNRELAHGVNLLAG